MMKRLRSKTLCTCNTVIFVFGSGDVSTLNKGAVHYAKCCQPDIVWGHWGTSQRFGQEEIGGKVSCVFKFPFFKFVLLSISGKR